ncbi:CCR4-NOT transcription complex subunit 7-like [Tubulanus polymorphus]|uniref:CCR4-NOT transcription complex subunit 7-like n=1 Tax=Tubulanus polymorphus TaxID=672921 RepID=UPI003DA5055E
MTINNMPGCNQSQNYGIRDVWDSNVEEEFKKIRKIIHKYSFVAMDTEFPGVVARPIGEFRSTSEYQYQLLKCNVDLLKIIQVGLTFMDENGDSPQPYCTWQFNFKFSLTEDMYAQDSIDLLQNSGIQFTNHAEKGIDVDHFAELLTTSGIVLTDKIKWLSFHSGYDFGYLLKLLTGAPLPSEESEFFDFLRIYFPNIYDVKYLMKSCKNLKGGLQEVSEQLEIQRIGPQHQAGSDSLLTGASFFKMKEMFFEDNIDDNKYCGHLYGLGTSYVQNGSAYENATSNSNHGYTGSSSTNNVTTNGDVAPTSSS